jgi:glutamine synthetase
MMGNLNTRELERLVDQGAVDTVVTVFPDMIGRFLGKRITGHFFREEVIERGMHMCDYLLACDMEMDPVPGYAFTSWDTGYGDFHAVPDMTTLRLVPWLEKTALVVCDLFDTRTHEPISIAPRQILAQQVERARAHGFTAKLGSELEFYVFRGSYEQAKARHYHDLEPFGWYIEDYHILQSTKEEGFIRAIRNGMDAAGVPVEFSKGEWGPGQHEINLRYAEAMEMADRHSIYKHGAKEIGAQHDVALTFMAKWDERHAGSSCHIHSSLWNTGSGEAVFFDSTAGEPSETFRRWLGGQIAHAAELTLFFAPFINSYKRYQAGSFAPTRLAWSVDNRTVGFRIIGHGPSVRVENRIPGADANPYLAFAATIAAGLDGIENGLDPGDAFEGDAYKAGALPSVPKTLPEAIAALESSSFARRAFGDDVVEHYLHAARTEVQKFNNVVTCWERERHFERT